MSLLSGLTTTPLLWACGLLLAACAWLGWNNHSLAAERDVAAAQRDTAVQRVGTVETERDAWKTRADELQAARAGDRRAIDMLRGLLAQAQGESARLEREGEQAVAAAQARAAEADRTLDAWMDRYAAQVRQGDCQTALAAVQQACPAMEGY